MRPNTTVQKPTTSSVNPNSSVKPTAKFDSAASTAQRKQESKAVFEASKPKPVEKSKPTVAVNTPKTTPKPVTPSAQTIRNTVNRSEYENRTTRVEHHYHTHYGDRYNDYYSRPYINVGGGYSALFWYSMLDWSADRQARWFYHNQNVINQQYYQQQLTQNAQLRAEVERLKAQNVTVNPQYVDSEYQENPDLMYSQEYVKSVMDESLDANSVPVSRPKVIQTQNSWVVFVIWSFMLIVIVGGLIYLVFFHNFKGE